MLEAEPMVGGGISLRCLDLVRLGLALLPAVWRAGGGQGAAGTMHDAPSLDQPPERGGYGRADETTPTRRKL